MKSKITDFQAKSNTNMKFLEIMGEEYFMFNGRTSEKEIMKAALENDLTVVIAKIADLQKEEKGLTALLKNAEPEEEKMILKKIKKNESEHLHWLLVLYNIFVFELIDN